MPEQIEVGDVIRHKLVPQFHMPVLAVEPCVGERADFPGVEHQSYKVIDPEGNEDWLCGLDVELVEHRAS